MRACERVACVRVFREISLFSRSFLFAMDHVRKSETVFVSTPDKDRWGDAGGRRGEIDEMQKKSKGAMRQTEEVDESGVDEVHAPQPLDQREAYDEGEADGEGGDRRRPNGTPVGHGEFASPTRTWSHKARNQSAIPLQAKLTRSSEPGVDEVNAPSPIAARRGDSYLEQELSQEEEERTFSEAETIPQEKRSRRESFRIHWHRFVVVSWLMFFSLWGALGRIGLVWLEGYRGAPVFGLIWAQFIGCAVIGFLAEDATLFSAIGKASPLYVGIGTGFAGSLTSFSSFTLDAFDGMANSLPGRSKGFNVLALLAQVIVTISMSVNGLRLGAHVNKACKWMYFFRPISPRLTQGLDLLGIVLGWGCLTGAIIITAILKGSTWRLIGFTAIFAPFGALLRYVLARLLNTRVPHFPLGTFAANIIGTLLLAVCVVVTTAASPPGVSRAVLYGLENGFCGSLTTISTFTLELTTLRRKAAWVYGSVSITSAFCLVVLIVGSFTWNSE